MRILHVVRRARCRLYRSRILDVDTFFAASAFAIYAICALLHFFLSGNHKKRPFRALLSTAPHSGLKADTCESVQNSANILSHFGCFFARFRQCILTPCLCFIYYIIMLCMFAFCYVSIFLLPQNPYSAASKAMPPAELFLPFLQRVFQRIEASGRGWLLEKGPRCVEHFEPWRAAGIFPEKVL